jgi:hypothetical protein
MSLRQRVARLLLSRKHGAHARPGSGVGVRLVQPDGSEVALVAQGDAFDLYLVPVRGDAVHAVELDVGVAVTLARWVLRWWAYRAWYGWRMRLWSWMNRA